jgi:hypothetical protein
VFTCAFLLHAIMRESTDMPFTQVGHSAACCWCWLTVLLIAVFAGEHQRLSVPHRSRYHQGVPLLLLLLLLLLLQLPPPPHLACDMSPICRARSRCRRDAQYIVQLHITMQRLCVTAA